MSPGSYCDGIAAQMVTSRSEAVLVTEATPGREARGVAPVAILGILTATDIARHVFSAGKSLDEVVAMDVMTRNPTCTAEGEVFGEVLPSMLEGRCRHMTYARPLHHMTMTM